MASTFNSMQLARRSFVNGILAFFLPSVFLWNIKVYYFDGGLYYTSITSFENINKFVREEQLCLNNTQSHIAMCSVILFPFSFCLRVAIIEEMPVDQWFSGPFQYLFYRLRPTYLEGQRTFQENEWKISDGQNFHFLSLSIYFCGFQRNMDIFQFRPTQRYSHS